MSAHSKDSAAVIKFMSLFEKLKDWSDNEPESLPKLVEADEGLKNLCISLCGAAHTLTMNERRRRELFAAPVDPKFRDAWRDYEDRFAKPVATIWLADLIPNIGNAEPEPISQAELNWDNANHDGAQQSGAIESAIEFAHEQANQDWRSFPEDFRESIDDARAAWERLKHDAGFDLQGVFRRRELVPFVLVPRHVAAKYGNTDPSMLKNLQQAHDAFIFGAPFAALALMRSIMESLVRNHYGAEGEDLNLRQCIDQARKRLPSGASAAALHRLRRLANTILHLKPEKDEGPPKIEPLPLEKEIVSLLLVLRALIEGAPQSRTR
jgi:hypothetical protein